MSICKILVPRLSHTTDFLSEKMRVRVNIMGSVWDFLTRVLSILEIDVARWLYSVL